MKSTSQVGQDLWVVEQAGAKPGEGTFLDVGCGHPIDISNTCSLERHLGWSGVGIDGNITLEPEWKAVRLTPFHLADARTIDWPALLLKYHLPARIDYLSLDTDGSQLDVVRAFPWDRIRFRCLTVEHDSYRFGNAPRDKIRLILTRAGYRVAVPDVRVEGLPFEDWWVEGKKKNPAMPGPGTPRGLAGIIIG